jgi:hypothetical protein
MTNQLQGEILFDGWAGDGGEGGVDSWAYTPWMPVRGDIGTFGVEVLVAGGATLAWEVQTRTEEDSSWAGISAIVTTGTGVLGLNFAINSVALPARQWVRYRFKTSSTSSVANFVIFRALQPSWQINR